MVQILPLLASSGGVQWKCSPGVFSFSRCGGGGGSSSVRIRRWGRVQFEFSSDAESSSSPGVHMIDSIVLAPKP